ncbi:hypothetical protein PRIPAC_79044 [Pristionchus pacificus]|uniref:G protein-coupled receptor n=1 Tax=Pristionchus pacificus TaxID=54126 RepID=A0A2A6C4L9_PRIPA|nr:hypothetical protein PRIPAC_79044 [Pristionchus pacificus]|eukprot:PDM73115.1 G protein-coupled receptor [Pristionchus pacificus]
MSLSLEDSLSLLNPINDWYIVIIYVGSALSFLLCALLSFIVFRHTPTSMHSRKVSLLNLLAGCLILTFFYVLTQPMPIFPFRILLFSGPLKSFGSTTAGVLYMIWFSVMTFMGNGCLVASLSHYLDLTTGSQNRIFRYLRGVTLRKRLILFNCFHLEHFIVSIVTIAVLVLSTFFGWILSYASGITFLNYSISKQMKELQSSISPKTFALLSSMSRIFFSVILAPLFFFFLPHSIFNVCNFLWPEMVSTQGWLILITLLVTILYGLFPFSIYLFLVIGFKQYRSVMFDLLTFNRFSNKNSPTQCHRGACLSAIKIVVHETEKIVGNLKWFSRMRMTMGIVIFHIDVPLAPDGVTSKTVFPDSLTVISIEFYLGSQTRLIFAFILTEEFWKNCFRRHAFWSQPVISIEFYLGSQTRLIFAFILTEEFWKNCFRRHAFWSQPVISIEFYLGSQTRLIFAFILTEEFWKNCFRRHAFWSQRDTHSDFNVFTQSIPIKSIYDPELESLQESLEDEHALIPLERHSFSPLLVTLSFSLLFVSYAYCIAYLNYSISKHMINIKSTISSKTFSLLSSMSHIFYSLIIAPLFFFFLPHSVFIVCNYHWNSMVATQEWLMSITVIVTVLYGLFPFSIYLFLAIGFKQYRIALFHILTFHRFSNKKSPANSR